MSPLVSFEQSITDAANRIENAHAETESIRRALTWGCAVLEGYYRAGAVAKFEFEAACVYLRRIANSRTAMQDLREAAMATGLGDRG